MNYFEVAFHISAPEPLLQDVRDVVACLAGDAGFETFEDTLDGMKGYVQQSLFDEEALRSVLVSLPFEDEQIKVGYDVHEAERRDWNEQWEQEGFAPVRVSNNLVVHDGHHLPAPSDDELQVEIDARMAFGTGNHATTCLMAEALMEKPMEQASLLDCGTGTGILSIVALLNGASAAVGYDIDEWSVDNAVHNAKLNGVAERFTAILGDSTVIETLNKKFDYVLANINRNILLADMERFRSAMKPDGAVLMLSGFYSSDVSLLKEKAQQLGLVLQREKSSGEWAYLEFSC